MKKLHINIFGDIAHANDSGAEDWGIISAKMVKAQLDRMPDAEEIVVHINTRGGQVQEGFAIHDLLVGTKKKITTINEGLTASIGTVIYLAGSEREALPNSQFMIHNPWGGIEGTADEIQKYADYMQQEENRIADFYVQKTGADKAMIQAKMEKETFMTPAEALELKFVTKITEAVKAIAFSEKLKQNPMNKVVEQLQAAIAKLTAALAKGSIEPAKGLVLKAQDGQELTIATEKAEASVGDTVTIAGKPAPDGSYKLPDNRTLVIAAGKISEIQAPPAASATDTEKLTQLEKENGELKKKITAFEATEKEVLAKVKGFEAILAGISSTEIIPAASGEAVMFASTGEGLKPKQGQTRLERRKELEDKERKKLAGEKA